MNRCGPQHQFSSVTTKTALSVVKDMECVHNLWKQSTVDAEMPSFTKFQQSKVVPSRSQWPDHFLQQLHSRKCEVCWTEQKSICIDRLEKKMAMGVDFWVVIWIALHSGVIQGAWCAVLSGPGGAGLTHCRSAGLYCRPSKYEKTQNWKRVWSHSPVSHSNCTVVNNCLTPRKSDDSLFWLFILKKEKSIRHPSDCDLIFKNNVSFGCC